MFLTMARVMWKEEKKKQLKNNKKCCFEGKRKY